MKIFLSKEDMLQDVIQKINTIWIVRKHPRAPFRINGHLEAFTIHKIYHSLAEAKAEAEKRNKKSSYLFTVKRIYLGRR